MRAMKGIAAALILTALPWSAAHAHGGIGIGINLGAPFYGPYWGGPYYRPYPYYYYNPYPVYVTPPAVVVQPAYSSPVEAPPPPAPVAPPATIAPQIIQPTGLRQEGIEQELPLLDSTDDHVRADAAVQLGRLKATRAVQPLMRLLAGDRSASVREASARALGLIGDTATLPALQRAAQADDDRDVRHSAQFAAEGIRSGLPR